MSSDGQPTDHAALVRTIQSVWATELGSPAAPDDDFFTAGGTSLAAARIVGAMREQGIDTAFTVLMRHSTPARFAAAILAGDGAARLSLPHLEDGDTPPVTVQQETIWFLEQLRPDNIAYQNLAVIDLPERVDRMRLADALAALAARHSLLRTSFPVRRGRPVLLERPDPVVHLDTADLSASDPAERNRWIRDLGRQRFDLTEAGALRWTLAELGDGRQALILVEHHFLHDGWSLGRLMNELAHVYRTGSSAGLPALLHRYADYAAWQRMWLHTDDAAASRKFWAELLADPVEPLRLGDDARRPAEFSFTGDTYHDRLPAAVVAAADSYARSQRTTSFVVLMAAFAAVIGGVSRNPDFNLGSMMRNRRVPGTEDILGMFVNTIALPVRGWPTRTMRDLTAELSEVLTRGLDHQEIPFPSVARELRGGRDGSRNPHFQVCFSMNDYPDLRPAWGPGKRASLRFPSNGGAKFDLDVVLVPDPQGYGTLWRFCTPLLTAEQVRGLATVFHAAVRALTGAPDTPISVVLGDVLPGAPR
ncbi:condensation domain-containing protein [Micromonospora sp. NPDC005298]|uniref:condensation domain-containing protein n=1 Tax=Micromonospora sp. NPDC005298 TaxID=3156873 RepID=UPI0033BBD0F3